MTEYGTVLVNDRYEMQQRIGRGGMAEVYLARDILLDRLVAIKVLFPEYATDPLFVERFRREAQSAANLNHPNIVSVYDWGRSENTYFMAMEYVPGRTLAEALHDVGAISAMKAAEIGIEVAAALSFAHRNNVVHRDIKPGNILIGSSGQLKVADFGIARALGSASDSSLTQAGAVMGTAAYFSPEQAQGAQPDPRSDLYSLGVVLYEMVAGRPPFLGDTPLAIAYKQVHEDPTPLHEFAPDVPRAFEAIVARLLTKDPDRRYATAEAVRDELRRFRDGVPVQALADILNAKNNVPISEAATTVIPTATATTPLIGAGDGVTPGDGTPTEGATRVLPRTMINSNPAFPPGYTESDFLVHAEELKTRRVGLIVTAVLGSIVLIAALVLGALFLTSDRQTGVTIPLPNVVGFELQTAVTTLEDLGFEVVTVAEENTDVEPNVVWSQAPEGGELLSQGSPVTITYNPSNAPIPVPDISGKTLLEARSALLNLGLIVGLVTYETHPTIPAEQIISTSPDSGEQVLGGATIDIVVSQGSGVVTIPNLQNQSLFTARSTLEGEPYKFIVTVVEEASNTIEPGRVTRTGPSAGTQATREDAVTIYVSTGAVKVTVLPVEGLEEAEARDRLINSGLKVTIEYVIVPAGNSNKGIVISQNPSAGTEVNPGTTILLKVGKEAPPTTTSEPSPSSSTTSIPS
jgi:serine/threonine-protein kinase